MRLVFMKSRVGSSGPATFFFGDGSRNHFYGHSLPSTDSNRELSVTGERMCT